MCIYPVLERLSSGPKESRILNHINIYIRRLEIIKEEWALWNKEMEGSLREIPYYIQQYIYLRVTLSAAAQHNRWLKTFKKFLLALTSVISGLCMSVQKYPEREKRNTSIKVIYRWTAYRWKLDLYFVNWTLSNCRQ